MKRFTRSKSLLAGVVIGATLSTGAAYAATDGQLIEVFYEVKNLVINNVSHMPQGDSTPFIYNGTTFVPLRYVSEALGQPVKWDGAKQTVYIGAVQGEENAVYPGSGIKSMNFQGNGAFWTLYDSKNAGDSSNFYGTVSVQADNAGNQYDNAVIMGGRTQEMLLEYPLNGQYKEFKSKLGLTDDSKNTNNTGTMEIYLDGNLAKSYKVEAGKFPDTIDLDVSNANKISFDFKMDYTNDSHYPMDIGLFDARFVK